MSVRLDPPFPIVLSIVFIAIALALGVALYIVRAGRRLTPQIAALISLRAAVLLLLAAILLNPVVAPSKLGKPAKPPLLILVDSSRSMSTRDCALIQSTVPASTKDKISRWDMVRAILGDSTHALATLASNNALRFATFDSALRSIENDVAGDQELARRGPTGTRTDITEAIEQAVGTIAHSDAPKGQRAGAILLLSDGRDNGGRDPDAAARLAQERRVPIYTITLGTLSPHREIQIVNDRAQQFALPHELVTIGATLVSSGLNAAPVRLELLRNGALVQSQSVRASQGRQPISFKVEERTEGLYSYTVAASTNGSSESAAVSGARDTSFLHVSDARTRILLLEGQPTWDAHFLTQALRSDAALSLDTVFKITDGNAYAVSGAGAANVEIPRSVEDFGRYDVVILGRGYEAFFDAAATESLKRWVATRGGSLVFLRGRADERTAALRELEPLDYTDREIDGARISLTAAGRARMPILGGAADKTSTVVNRLPGLISATQVGKEKALAVVLARTPDASDTDAPEMALIASQRYGDGKVLAIVGEGLWRWALLDPSQRQYDDVYNAFWSETMRWMTGDSDFLPGQVLTLRTDRSHYSTGDTVQILATSRTASTDAFKIRIFAPNGETSDLRPARSDSKAAELVTIYQPESAGEYIAEAIAPNGHSAVRVSAATTFHVGQANDEDTNRSADPALMDRIAKLSGGNALRPSELESLAQKLTPAPFSERRIEPPKTLWDRGALIGVIVALLAAEWLLRQREGLP